MFFRIAASTSADPQEFAATIRQELAEIFPHADVQVRPILSRTGARLAWIETDCETANIVENVRSLCDVATDWLQAA